MDTHTRVVLLVCCYRSCYTRVCACFVVCKFCTAMASLGNAPYWCVLGSIYALTSSLPLLQDVLVGDPISGSCTLHHSLKPHREEMTLDAALKEDPSFCNPSRTPMPLPSPHCSSQLAPLKHAANVFVDHACNAARPFPLALFFWPSRAPPPARKKLYLVTPGGMETRDLGGKKNR